MDAEDLQGEYTHRLTHQFAYFAMDWILFPQN
jgi:hypothetical protein